MKKEIVSIDSKQAAKIVAITSSLLMCIFSIVGLITLIVGVVQGSEATRALGMMYFLMPLWYFVIAYLFSRLTYWIYNKVAARMGGIVVELKDKPEA